MLARTGRHGIAGCGLLVVALLAACSSSAGGTATVTPKSGATITETAQRPFTVKLASNPTTGFSWAVKHISGGVKFVESKYVAPKGNRAGAPGQQVLTFDAGPIGASHVQLAYERPFAPRERGKSLAFTVEVKSA